LLVATSSTNATNPKMLYIVRTSSPDIGWQKDELQVSNLDGRNNKLICTGKFPGPICLIESAVFSPDNKSIYFISEVNSRQRYLYAVNIDGTNMKQVADNCWEIECGNASPKIKGLSISYTSLRKMINANTDIVNKVSSDGKWILESEIASAQAMRYYITDVYGSRSWEIPIIHPKDMAFSNPCGVKILERSERLWEQSRIKLLKSKRILTIEETVEYYNICTPPFSITPPPYKDRFRQKKIAGDYAAITNYVVDAREHQYGGDTTYLLKKAKDSWKVIDWGGDAKISKNELVKLSISADTIKQLGWSIYD
jgi:hypothetical protein